MPSKKPSGLQSTGKILTLNKISSDIKKKVQTKTDITESTIEENQELNQENKEFSPTQLDVVWRTYAEGLKNEEKSAELSVVNQPYELKSDNQIVIKLANSLHVDILERFRMDFVQYLRHSLKNNHIRISTEIVKEEIKQRLYTAQDKFNHMAEKNPKLLELKQRLGLEYDY